MNPGSTRFNSGQYSSLSPRPGSGVSGGGGQHTYLSPQLARLNSTLRPSAHAITSSTNGSPVHRQSAMSSTTTLSTCLSPRSGRYPLSEAECITQPHSNSHGTYDQNHVYCEIPVNPNNSQIKRVEQPGNPATGLRLIQHQLQRGKLRQQETAETELFYEDTTQCDLHNISDLSDDEQQWSFSANKTPHSISNSPKHFPVNSSRNQRQQLNNSISSPGHINNKKQQRTPNRFQQHHQHVSTHLSPPPLKQNSTKVDQMSQLPATDV